jgi:hypothetical protein
MGSFVKYFTDDLFRLLNIHYAFFYIYSRKAVVVVIIWQLDLQLPVRSVPITTKVVSSNPAHSEMYSIQHYVI